VKPDPDHEIVPRDSRYIPLQQQPYCCAATCIQIVLLSMGLPLRPAEEIGWHFGLTIPPEEAEYFYNPRVSETEPEIGYGTQVGRPEIDADAAFKALGLPVRMIIEPETDFKTGDELWQTLKDFEEKGAHILLCLRWKDVLDPEIPLGPGDPLAQHLVVFDRVLDDGRVRVIDPGRGPKWKIYTAEGILKSMGRHEHEAASGLWILEKI